MSIWDTIRFTRYLSAASALDRKNCWLSLRDLNHTSLGLWGDLRYQVEATGDAAVRFSLQRRNRGVYHSTTHADLHFTDDEDGTIIQGRLFTSGPHLFVLAFVGAILLFLWGLLAPAPLDDQLLFLAAMSPGIIWGLWATVTDRRRVLWALNQALSVDFDMANPLLRADDGGPLRETRQQQQVEQAKPKAKRKTDAERIER
jgi:hypothetical protein